MIHLLSRIDSNIQKVFLWWERTTEIIIVSAVWIVGLVEVEHNGS
jgi:hypothetical protein